MDTSGSTHEPEDTGIFRRGLFPRRDPAQAEPSLTEDEARIMTSVQQAVDERVDQGIRELEEQATGLLREVASEVWRTSARDVRPEQERIMSILARDQTVRSLIATSDERFQAIAVRTARLEDNLQDLSESERRTREAMENAAFAIREIADSPTLHGVEGVRTQLEQVERHIAETFAHFDERDALLKETVLTQVKEHGELIANETTRVVEAMQAYVQGGTEAIGRLAQRIEEHAKLFVLQDHNITEGVRDVVAGAVESELGELLQQVELVREKVGLHGREQEQLQASLERLIDARMRGVAELVRSDSMALQTLIQERMSAAPMIVTEDGVRIDEGAMVRAIDDRMGSMEQIMAERMLEMERNLSEQIMANAAAAAASMERTVERMTAAAGSVDGLDELVAEGQGAAEERMRQHIDERMTALARLVRSDSQALAARVEALAADASAAGEPIDAELLRQVLRSVKELHATMASDITMSMDQRFQSVSDQLHREAQGQAEAMLKVAEALGSKIDRLTVRVDEGVGNDLQIVVDRMSDAIRAMSTVRRDIA
jgi:predicted GNAT family N-acyltransferase